MALVSEARKARSVSSVPAPPVVLPQVRAALEAAFAPGTVVFDEIYRAVYARDGSYFEYEPQAVVRVASVADVQELLRIGSRHAVPITLRAGGSSLSGQTVGTGIIADQRFHFRQSELREGGRVVWFEPGLTVVQLNARLKAAGKKVGPDPASSQVAMMGGVLANNASGMQAGTKYNAYQTLVSIDFVLPSGRRYDTAKPADRERFAVDDAPLAAGLAALRDELRADAALCERVRRKYQIKNVSGYTIAAFLDYDDPLDILAHLLIGSEGTLAYIAAAELQTIPLAPCAASTLLFFADVVSAAAAVPTLVETGAAAIELMDIASLRSVIGRPGVPPIVETLPDGVAALLIDYTAEDPAALVLAQERAAAAIGTLALFAQLPFSTTEKERAQLWTVRSGIFASVGGARTPGTTVILEDVAVPVDRLADLILGLQGRFAAYGYDGAIFGHASVGNIHFLVTDDMGDPQRVAHFGRFMDEVVELVLRFDGSLKAEHGTGRAMAPFIKAEWGETAYAIMRRIKTLVDPAGIMNPGVIVNDDPDVHLAHIKGMPLLGDPVTDRCIECGFCEWVCPTRYSALTPRHRIQAHRAHLSAQQAGDRARAATLARQYVGEGRESCVADGMCQIVCPVGINTGFLTDHDRKLAAPALSARAAPLVAEHFGLVEDVMRASLTAGAALGRIAGPRLLPRLTAAAARYLPSFPRWSANLGPAPARRASRPARPEIVYFPSCVTRLTGSSTQGKDDVMRTVLRVAERAGIAVALPRAAHGLCCSQPFAHKGATGAQAVMARRVIDAMYDWSEGGRLPIMCDVTSCVRTFRHEMESEMWGARPPLLDAPTLAKYRQLRFVDIAEWLHQTVLPRLDVTRPKESIVLHPTCACHHLGLVETVDAVGRACARASTRATSAGCCGAGGDRGFRYPAGAASALRDERAELEGRRFDGAYSVARTCEVVLSDHLPYAFESIVYLVDETTSARATTGANVDEPHSFLP